MSCYDRRCDSAGSGGITYRKFGAELFGTALLVFFGCGVATLMFGFGFDGGSVAAGVVATALAFGLVLLSLAYVLGPVSGCHVNPAVTVGALLAGRIPLAAPSATGSPSSSAASSARWSCGGCSAHRPCTASPKSVSGPMASARSQ
jgi:hypothetical protein